MSFDCLLNTVFKRQIPLIYELRDQTLYKSRFYLITFGLILFVGACEPKESTTNGSEETDSQLDAPKESSVMRLTGDFSAFYNNGRFVVFTPNKASSRRAAGVASTMATAASTVTPASSTSQNDQTQSGTSDDTEQSRTVTATRVEDSINVLGQVPISADGTFHLSIEVTEPHQVYFYVLDAVSESGSKWAPTKGQQFILEPGDLTITMNPKRRWIVEGGVYNDAVFNIWKASDEYIQAYEEYDALLVAVEGETEEERRHRVDAYSAKFSEILDLEVEGRARTSLNHPDPLVRKLTLQTTWLHGSSHREALHRLAALTPDDPWVVEQVAAADERFEKIQNESQIAIGTEILDFEAQTLAGETVAFGDVLANSEVVLLEFWASWCGPCRVEIPHMKQAYERFKDQGFEIVSFTIDDWKEDWQVASEEEELPWHDLGMGSDADAPKKYNITGVPHNYLVNAESGLIIAKNLRQHKLDERLEEEFNVQ